MQKIWDPVSFGNLEQGHPYEFFKAGQDPNEEDLEPRWEGPVKVQRSTDSTAHVGEHSFLVESSDWQPWRRRGGYKSSELKATT
ncbi:hypothetical protein [Curtobacterium sp. BRB10]|uniref:hypothetical protein n=1 Tax=Curtobacterium sp. BRB10 TaxID=2962579 RepID=UPI0028821E7C|nr:hypothetical protein [Curtobacterium sp. BRB10]MDT0235399.1 hypothetical protein [Curtobacterium sp. BRB10]